MKTMKIISLIAIAASLMSVSARACKVSDVDYADNNGWCVADGTVNGTLIQTTCRHSHTISYSWSANLSQVSAAILAAIGQEEFAAIVAGTTVKVAGSPGVWSYVTSDTAYVSATLHPEDHRWKCSDRKPEAGESGYNSCKNNNFECFATADYPDCLGGTSHKLHVYVGPYSDIIADDSSGSCS